MTISSLMVVAAALAAAAPTSNAEWERSIAEASAQVKNAAQEGKVGVLLMAHGGSPDWNAAVEAAVRPLAGVAPVEIAFGMADAATMQRAADRLEARGVGRVAVVRLFISGDSFLERAEQILGLRPGAPPRPPHGGHPGHGHGGHGHVHGPAHGPGHGMEFWRLQSGAEFALSREGLMDAGAAVDIVAERALALSRKPSRESILLLAHGPEDDAENRRWLARMEAAAAPLRQRGFRAVSVETLREDWPQQRREAEARIRSFVEAASQDGEALVIPYRLFGFGPYREVLAGLSYRSDGLGLLPHPKISGWIRAQAASLCADRGWSSPL